MILDKLLFNYFKKPVKDKYYVNLFVKLKPTTVQTREQIGGCHRQVMCGMDKETSKGTIIQQKKKTET